MIGRNLRDDVGGVARSDQALANLNRRTGHTAARAKTKCLASWPRTFVTPASLKFAFSKARADARLSILMKARTKSAFDSAKNCWAPRTISAEPIPLPRALGARLTETIASRPVRSKRIWPRGWPLPLAAT